VHDVLVTVEEINPLTPEASQLTATALQHSTSSLSALSWTSGSSSSSSSGFSSGFSSGYDSRRCSSNSCSSRRSSSFGSAGSSWPTVSFGAGRQLLLLQCSEPLLQQEVRSVNGFVLKLAGLAAAAEAAKASSSSSSSSSSSGPGAQEGGASGSRSMHSSSGGSRVRKLAALFYGAAQPNSSIGA